MNDGQGAWLRDQDRLLATGQLGYRAAGGVPTPEEVEAERRARIDVAAYEREVKRQFLAAMQTAGNPASKVLTHSSTGAVVRVWALGSHGEATQWAFGEDGNLYGMDVTTRQRRLGRSRPEQCLCAPSTSDRSLLPLARALCRVADENGVALDLPDAPSDQRLR
jgi:hypothetical protein